MTGFEIFTKIFFIYYIWYNQVLLVITIGFIKTLPVNNRQIYLCLNYDNQSISIYVTEIVCVLFIVFVERI